MSGVTKKKTLSLNSAEEPHPKQVGSADEEALREEKFQQQQKAAAGRERQIYLAISKESHKLNGAGFPKIGNAFYNKLGITEEKATGKITIQASDNPQDMSTAIYVGVLKLMQKTQDPVIYAEGGTPLQNVLFLQTLLAPSVSCSINSAKLDSIIRNIEEHPSECGAIKNQPLKVLIELSRLNSRLQAENTKPLSIEERHQALQKAVASDALSAKGISKEEAQEALKSYEAELQISEKAEVVADKARPEHEVVKEERISGASMDDDDEFEDGAGQHFSSR